MSKNSIIKTDIQSTSNFIDGLVSGEGLSHAFKKRNAKYIYKTIDKKNIEEYINLGWEKIPSRKKNIGIRRPKEIGPSFEDEVWCILYRMGFIEMNKDSNLSIPRYNSSVTKQIDVFAREEQCICIIECKSAETPHTKSSTKNIDKDIDQIAAISNDINLSIYKHYKELGNDEKFKIVWILALKNIDITPNDKERAEKANIKIIDESLWEYYSEFSKHFGHSAKYQFLSDLLPNRNIPDLIEPLPAIKGKMGTTSFYSFVIEPEKLLKIAYISHRNKTNAESIETYQRMAKKVRLTKISKYIHEKEGIFPTNIVINIETNKPLRFDTAADMAGKNAILGTLYLPNIYQCAWIIDGQHRLFAYSDLDEAKTATLPVIAFENLDPVIQSQLFININGEQVRVSRNHLNDMYANLHWNSRDPRLQLQALVSRLVKELDRLPKSPLRDKVIKIGGNKTDTRNLTLTSLTSELYKSQLLGYIHNNKATVITPGPLYQEDLDSTLNRSIDVIIEYYKLFLENENVKKQWEAGSGDGGYICTNLGIRATLRILKAILDHLSQKENIEIRRINKNQLINEIRVYIEPVIAFLGNASPSTIRNFKKVSGESGLTNTTYTLMKEIKNKHPNFEPTGLSDHIKRTDTSNNEEAYKYVKNVELIIQNHAIESLKRKFGYDISQWWHLGVNDNIKDKTLKEAQKAGEYKNYERFIYLVDLKEIIYDNWDIFSEIYTLDAKPTDNKKKRLEWFTKVNEIRNICAHPLRGGVTSEQLEFIKRINGELESRILIDKE